MGFPADEGTTYTTPNATDKLNNPSHTARHAAEAAEIKALKDKLGIDGDTDASCIDYLLKSLVGGHSHNGVNSRNALWSSIDKTISDLADLTTKSHTSLTDKGTNTHAQIDAHTHTGGDGTSKVKAENLDASTGNLPDGSAGTASVEDAAITSRKFKPTIDVAQGTSATMVLADTDYDVVSITVTPEVTSTVIIRFHGYSQQNTTSTMTLNVWKGAVKDTTNKMLVTNNDGAVKYAGAGRSWKYTGVTAAATTFKITGQNNVANIAAAVGSIEAEVIAE